jgi:hypothetical protein
MHRHLALRKTAIIHGHDLLFITSALCFSILSLSSSNSHYFTHSASVSSLIRVLRPRFRSLQGRAFLICCQGNLAVLLSHSRVTCTSYDNAGAKATERTIDSKTSLNAAHGPLFCMLCNPLNLSMCQSDRKIYKYQPQAVSLPSRLRHMSMLVPPFADHEHLML